MIFFTSNIFNDTVHDKARRVPFYLK